VVTPLATDDAADDDRADRPDDQSMCGIAKIDFVIVDAHPTRAQPPGQIAPDA
jgi:hypothetical protein